MSFRYIYDYGSDSKAIVNDLIRFRSKIMHESAKNYNPQSNSCYVRNAFKNGANIWFIPYSDIYEKKQDPNSRWKNHLSNPELIIEEYVGAEDDYHEDGKDHPIRLVFAHRGSSNHYYFYGVYQRIDTDEEPGVMVRKYKRIARDFYDSLEELEPQK